MIAMPDILLVTYEMNQGGTNRVLCELANGFHARGYTVTVICCTSAGALDSAFRNSLAQGIGYCALSDTAWSSRLWGQVRTFPGLRRWINAHRPDIVLATGNNISWFSGLGVLLARPPRPKFFIKTTNPIVRSRDGALVDWLRRKVYSLLFRKSDGVMTLSDAETRLLQTQFPKAAAKFSTVYNAYVTQRLDAVTPTLAAPSPPPWIILGVGRLVAQKNFSRLLEAFALVQTQYGHKDVMLQIAGDGEDRAMLEQKARALGIADTVRFLGFRDDVAQLMASSHLFVLSSDYEGLPAVVVESLAANCPVISTDCFANARDLLQNIPGCGISDCSSEDLARAMGGWLAAPPQKPDLKPYARPYTTDSSVDSHIRAMSEAGQ